MELGILYVIFNEWIRNPETDEIPYKIGITKNSIDERYYGLGLKMPGNFETLFAYRIEDYEKAEKSIHDIFSKKCINGEWFKLNPEDIEFIKEICKKMDGKLVTDEIKIEIKNETEKGEYMDFNTTLRKILSEAEQQDEENIVVISRDLHKRVGGYPGVNHQMPSCCAAMRSAMQDGDRIIEQPLKGNGATLKIEYQLPR